MQGEKMSGLGQLVAGITHEINNPIGFIYSNLEHAQQYVQDLLNAIEHYEVHATQDVQATIAGLDVEFIREDFPRLIGSMQMGSERIRDLIESLKTFARFDESAWKRVDLQEGLDSTLIMLGHRLKGNVERPEIAVVKRYGDLPLVDCYASALNQVFLSLLSNAIEALDQFSSNQNPGQIMIVADSQDDQIVITIADNGPGIPVDLQSKIFDPFFTTKPIGQGTGMGLAISHQIVVEQHGGSLTCQSAGGAGTTFVITIPKQPVMLHQPERLHQSEI
jgi:ammonium transporter, Amt family